MKNRLLAMFLALVMCLALALMPPAYGAENDFDINSNGVLFFYSGSGGDVIVPYGVTVINKQAFNECTQMTSVAIPDTVYQIGTDAFYGCTGLTSVDIPNSVTNILPNAFGGCTGLTHVSIPNSVIHFGHSAFTNTGLTGVYIPGSVETIQGRTFSDCKNLTDVVIGEGVTTISTLVSDGAGAFEYCTSLVNVTIPDTVTTIGNSAFYNCSSLTGVTVPSSVTSISSFAFMSCPNLTLYGSAGSYAETFAKENEIPFVVGEAPHIETGNEPDSQPATPQQPSTPTTPTAPATANPTNDKLTVNGQAVTPAAYKIGGANYFKLRDVAMMLSGSPKQFSVGYDNAAKSITLTTGAAYTPNGSELKGAPTANGTANPTNDVIYINGAKAELTVYKINGSNYFKIRDLAKALDFNVGWTQERGMFIEGDKSYTDAD